MNAKGLYTVPRGVDPVLITDESSEHAGQYLCYKCKLIRSGLSTSRYTLMYSCTRSQVGRNPTSTSILSLDRVCNALIYHIGIALRCLRRLMVAGATVAQWRKRIDRLVRR